MTCRCGPLTRRRRSRASTRRRAMSLPAIVACALTAVSCRDERSGGRECDYDRPQCGDYEVCALEPQPSTKGRCLALDAEPMPIAGPFADGQAFRCAQGPRSARGRSHSYMADVLATDFESAREGATAGQVVAPVTGIAYVFDECPERDNSAGAINASDCGLGYGNHVKVWDGQTLFLLGHLSRVLIAPGPVTRGQVIGIEGNSGKAGNRHLHFVATRFDPQREDLARSLVSPGWKGTIPTRFRVTLASGESVWNDELRCESR